jgi:hypothetical protein
MNARDRATSLGLFAAALMAWMVVAGFFVTRSPVGDVGVQVVGGLMVGVAVALVSIPLFWLAVFGRHARIAYRGDWAKAIRRGAVAGFVAALFVVLRSQDAFSWPLALFVVAMAVFIEIGLSTAR